MITRRGLLRGGLGGLALGLLGKRGLAFSSSQPAGGAADTGRPLAWLPRHPPSVAVGGLPFAPRFSGDTFPGGVNPFHTCENCFGKAGPPAPTETVDIAIVGGGISGLCTAYLLREHRPVLFELHGRFGGSSQGEVWRGAHYSLGGAYVITPDPGTFLEQIYKELRMDAVFALSEGGNDPVELYGDILFDFWHGTGLPQEEQHAIAQYAEVVTDVANNHYPDIPLPDGGDNTWILDLDIKTLKQDIEDRMGIPATPLLAGGIQAYCYSSFGAGWDEVSAASGWNFLAAEEFDRWVCPGGNAYIADAFWHRLGGSSGAAGGRRELLRPGCRVVDVRFVGQRVQVTYKEADGTYRGLWAKRVVMACPKHVCKYVLHDLEALDVEKLNAIHMLQYSAYVVANVLLKEPYDPTFYDVFLLRDGNFPMDPGEAEAHWKPIDMLNGSFAQPNLTPVRVLTLYWPLPWPSARFTLIAESAWRDYAERLAPQVKEMLALLGLGTEAVEQIRMTRWGHAIPVASPGLIAGGVTEHLRRPFEGKVFFVNEDNWALPAVENCLLDAEIMVPQIIAGL
ncbi:MAG: NAD(P)-binding protein [Phycisphaerae bacterium]